MCDDFLTIPDAPNYEINSDLLVRNKKTGRILKTQKDGFVSLSYNSKSIRRKAEAWYRQALNLHSDSNWLPIPSQPNYEMTSSGIVRHCRTKRILKSNKKGFFTLSDNRKPHKFTHRYKSSLLIEVFGKNIKSTTPIPVFVVKGNRQMYFDSIADASRFIAKKESYSVSWINNLFTRRFKNIFGYSITYSDSFDNTCRLNNEAARHAKRVWGTS